MKKHLCLVLSREKTLRSIHYRLRSASYLAFSDHFDFAYHHQYFDYLLYLHSFAAAVEAVGEVDSSFAVVADDFDYELRSKLHCVEENVDFAAVVELIREIMLF